MNSVVNTKTQKKIIKELTSEKYDLKTYKKPSYYDKIASTAIIIDLNEERQTTFRFVSFDRNQGVLGERIYFFNMDEYDINEIIAQLQNVKSKLAK